MKPLSEKQIAALSNEDRQTYKIGMMFSMDSWANGPYGGWARGHELLESVGYTQKERREGSRVFTSLEPPEEAPDA